ncbi:MULTISPECIES: hypothetical protein [Nostocales]|uniref:Uncharacterized protein n=3 Tax=Nostocales TaxID=1161 RepID=A0A8S9TB66_9CYAN|nr:hypothetical protein [Tolypothrix bouteillei]KAF3889801.1 hypothetical protein DA73_0400033285 [Tolypothrix bouteillei VB521301]
MTELEEDSIFIGTKNFFETLLKDMGIEGEVVNWLLKPYRSNYYTDYLGEADWHDVWQIVWKARVVTVEEISTFLEWEETYIESEAIDESASLSHTITDTATIGCLIVADFKSLATLIKTTKAIANANFSEIQHKYSVSPPIFNYSLSKKYKQLQIDIGQFQSDFFLQGADYAEQILEICKQAGGTVNYQERY